VPVLAIEILAACQAFDLLAPLRSSAALTGVYDAVRRVVPTLDDDRPPSPDIAAISGLIDDGALARACSLSLA